MHPAPYLRKPRSVRSALDQTMALSYSRPIGNKNDSASDNSRQRRERKAKKTFQELDWRRLSDLSDLVETVILGTISFIC